MKKIAVAVFTKISGNVTLCVEKAFYKALFLHLSNYFENAIYGAVIDLPDSPCYKSYGDREITEAVSRCYGALPKKYKDSFFVIVRARRYNVKHTKSAAFCCENGAFGALSDLLSGNTEYYFTLGEVPESYDYLYFSAYNGVIEAGGIKALLDTAVITGKNVFPFIKDAPYVGDNANPLKDAPYVGDNANPLKDVLRVGDNTKLLKNALRVGDLKDASDIGYSTRPLKYAKDNGKALFLNTKNGRFKLSNKEKNGFSALEGLYIKEKASSIKGKVHGIKEKNTKGSDKKSSLPSKGESVLLKSVYVLNIPENVEGGYKEAPFKRKRSFSRFAYRAALAASRLFTGIIEKDCVSVTDAEEAAECLVALVAMRAFNFLGEEELLKKSDILLDIIDEKMFIGYEKGDKGKLLFLLTVILSAYSALARFYSVFWSSVLRIKSMCVNLKAHISSMFVEIDSIYLVMCYKRAVADMNKKYYIPRSMEAMLSEKETDIFLQGNDFEDIETAFCVLVIACNVCFCGNIKDFLLSAAVFRAKSSYLMRTDREKQSIRRVFTDKRSVGKESFLLSKQGLSPVKERLLQSGANPSLVPFMAYFEKLIRQNPINNDNKVVKICYIVKNSSLLLENLVRASAAIPEITVSVIFDNSYAFTKARKTFGDKAEIFLCGDRERCDEVKRSSYVVRRLAAETTLSELMKEAREMGRFKANVKSRPSVFSHSLCGGGDLKNGFCTFLQSGKNVSYGEFIKNPFTEIKTVMTTFVPRLRVKLMRVTLSDVKYRSGTELFLLTEKGSVLETGETAQLPNGEKLTVIRQGTEDGVLFAVQVYKNEREKEYLKSRITEDGFFEICEAAIKTEIKTELCQAEILSEFLDEKLSEDGGEFFMAKLRKIIERQVPRSFFSKMIFLTKAGELKGERLPFAAKMYAEEFSDRKIFDICLPAVYTRSGESRSGEGKSGEQGAFEGTVGKGKSGERGVFEKPVGKGKSGERGVFEGTVDKGNPGERGVCVRGLGEEKPEEDKIFKKEYRYPFYIHCLDRLKNAKEIDGEVFETRGGESGFYGENHK